MYRNLYILIKSNQCMDEYRFCLRLINWGLVFNIPFNDTVMLVNESLVKTKDKILYKNFTQGRLKQINFLNRLFKALAEIYLSN